MNAMEAYLSAQLLNKRISREDFRYSHSVQEFKFFVFSIEEVKKDNWLVVDWKENPNFLEKEL